MLDINDVPHEVAMTAAIEGDDLVLRLPLAYLAWSQSQREDSVQIQDQRKMAQYLADNILDYGGDSEIGATAFELLVDGLFDHAIADGQDWLEYWFEIEDGDDGDDL